jgi:regulator of sirC expression with transglutaminase-like and TPR domain
MKRRALLLWLAASSCRRDARLGLGRTLVGAATRAGFADDELAEGCLAELGRLATAARRELDASGGRAPAQTLVKLVFERWGFVREVSDESVAFVLLPSVVKRRRGNCVGLGCLYLALADELGIPAAGVLRPGHFYVRAGSANSEANLEMLRSGELMPDSWYRERFPIRGSEARAYARPLTTDEVLGVIAYDVGNERRRQRRLPEAREAYSQAIVTFPELAEAHASLGAVEQLLGNGKAAAECYRRAREMNPQLPGVAENLALLEAEERARSDARSSVGK